MKYERIRNLRIDKGLTQEALAKVLNIKQNTYSQYEIGVLNYPLEVGHSIGGLLSYQR